MNKEEVEPPDGYTIIEWDIVRHGDLLASVFDSRVHWTEATGSIGQAICDHRCPVARRTEWLPAPPAGYIVVKEGATRPEDMIWRPSSQPNTGREGGWHQATLAQVGHNVIGFTGPVARKTITAGEIHRKSITWTNMKVPPGNVGSRQWNAMVEKGCGPDTTAKQCGNGYEWTCKECPVVADIRLNSKVDTQSRIAKADMPISTHLEQW